MLVLGETAFADTTWSAAGVTADWTTAGDWSNGIPVGGSNVLRAAVPINGNAVLPAGSASYAVEISSPATSNDITLNGNASHVTTLNINGALTTLGMAEGNPLGAISANGGSNTGTVINIGYVPVSVSASIGLSGATLNISAGATLTFGESCPNQGIRTSSSIINIFGALNATNGSYKGNSGLILEGGGGSSTCNINGGSAILDSLVLLSNVGQSTLSISNGGSLIMRTDSTNGSGIVMGDIWNPGASGYTNTSILNLTGGYVLNGSAATGKQYKLSISDLAGVANGPGSGAVNVSGGTFYQYGITYIGSGRNGSLNVSGSGTFTTTNTILVGGTGNTHSVAPSGTVTASGILAVSGGALNAASIKIGDGSFAALSGTLPAWSTVGTLNLSSGTLTTTSLTATNGTNSVIHFTGGTLRTQGTILSSGSLFTIGNGTLPATLNLNGGSHSFANNLSLSNHATLTGNGTIASGTLFVTNGATLSPGNSIGSLQTATEVWSDGGTYLWEISDSSGYDGLNITGPLNISVSSSNFVINLASLGALTAWNNQSVQTWPLASASGGITGFQANKFTVNSGNFSNFNPLGGGTFSVGVSGNNLNLVFSPGYTPVQAWRAANGLPVDGSGIGADRYDLSGNGMPNLQKYALGLSATSTSLSALPAISTATGRLAISFQRDPTLTDINYIVEASPDLSGTWTPIASSVAGAATANLGGAFSVSETGATLRRVTVEDLPLLSSSARRFLRLKIVRP